MSVNSIFIILLSIILGTPISKKSDGYTLTVNIYGIESNSGHIICNLHNDEKSFPKKYLLRKKGAIKDNKSQIIFSGIVKGEYAVTAIHDENSNDRIDFNLLHIPTEKMGTSNNAKGFFGPPKFRDAKILIDKNTTISINLN